MIEALASGLPVAVSKDVGCWPDVIGNEAKGRVLPPNDVTLWANTIRDITHDRTARQRTQENWAKRKYNFLFDTVTDNLAKFLHQHETRQSI